MSDRKAGQQQILIGNDRQKSKGILIVPCLVRSFAIYEACKKENGAALRLPFPGGAAEMALRRDWQAEEDQSGQGQVVREQPAFLARSEFCQLC